VCKVLAKPHRATPTNYKHEIIIAEFEIIAARAQQLFMELLTEVKSRSAINSRHFPRFARVSFRPRRRTLMKPLSCHFLRTHKSEGSTSSRP